MPPYISYLCALEIAKHAMARTTTKCSRHITGADFRVTSSWLSAHMLYRCFTNSIMQPANFVKAANSSMLTVIHPLGVATHLK